ncbi:MAG TPA: SDR family NAD(P)-dependent oxidoreductase [Gemmataceae bacterium]
MPLANQVAVVTGASSGIGGALAEELARRGCRLGLIARRRDLLDQLAGKLRGTGAVAEVAAADVADRDRLLAAFAELRQKLGPVDVLVANAGVNTPAVLEPMNVPGQLALLRVNLFGVIVAVEAVLPDMLARRSGRIAAVSSLGAYKGLPGAGAYCASKAAVNVYLEALRIQLRGRGVSVTTLCPGFVRTPMVADNPHPMPFLLEPADAARRMVRAVERRAKVYDFPWRMAALMRVVRWLPDWVVARVVRE